MKLKVSLTSSVNAKEHSAAIANDSGFWLFAASQWHKLYSPYVPMDSGNLMGLVTIRPKEIVHNAPYAGRCYRGTRMAFRKDHHPLASAQWDKAARTTQLPKLVRTMRNYIASGRLKV